MTYPIVDLTFWNPGDPPAPAVDALLADPATPLARHGLAGIASVYSDTTGANLDTAHRWWADELAAKSLAVDGALTEVVPALRAAGVRFFIAKGPTIAHSGSRYPDPTMRSYTDLDVYVAPVGCRAAERSLRALGYQPVHHVRGPLGGMSREHHGGSFGAVVELHTHPADNLHGRFLPGLTPYFDFVVDTTLFGTQTPTLSPDASLALELVHLAASHRYARLALLRDVSDRITATPATAVARFGAASYHRVAHAILQRLRDDRGTASSRVGALLGATDPTTWNEHDASVRNVLSLIAQPTLRHAAVASAAVARAGIPRRGRRAPLRWPVRLNGRVPARSQP